MEPWIWTVLLFVLAVGIGFLELFVPSGGVLAVLAVLALIGSVIFGFMQHPVFGGVYLFLMVIGVPLLIREMFRIWPNTPIGKKLLLDPEQDPALDLEKEYDQYKQLLGQSGVVKSPMFPSGRVEIDGRQYDAISQGIPIDLGTPVMVIQVEGNIVTVQPQMKPKKPAPPQSKPPGEEGIQVEDPFA